MFNYWTSIVNNGPDVVIVNDAPDVVVVVDEPAYVEEVVEEVVVVDDGYEGGEINSTMRHHALPYSFPLL